MINPRLTVVIITYKQQDLIRRSLNSVLSQKEHGLKEIIISDDCSPDNTWATIMEYKNQYPEYIRPYRNSPNLGIYANLQKALSYVKETDLVLMLSGDDEFCPGYFEQIVKCVQDNNIDLHSCYSILGDWKVVSPSGKETIFRQNIISKYQKQYDPLSLKIRHIISGRSSATSFEAVKKFKWVPVEYGVSYAENYFDIQPYLYSERFYHIPVVGSIYYSAVGVSRTMFNKTEYKRLADVYKSMQSHPTIMENPKDVLYLKHLVYKYNYLACKSPVNLIKTVWFFIISYKYPVGLRKLMAETYHLFF